MLFGFVMYISPSILHMQNNTGGIYPEVRQTLLATNPIATKFYPSPAYLSAKINKQGLRMKAGMHQV